MHLNSKLSLLACAVLLTMSGCSSSGDVGYVSGVVTLNGKPLENATITFYPKDARGSIGRTDASGKYDLLYVRNQKGAVIGDHRVTVSTKVVVEVDRGNQGYDGVGESKQRVTQQGRPESMPPKYLDPQKTELTATVQAGSNKIDFDLSL